MILTRQPADGVLTIPAPRIPDNFAKYFFLAAAYRQGFFDGVQAASWARRDLKQPPTELRFSSLVERAAYADGFDLGFKAYAIAKAKEVTVS